MGSNIGQIIDYTASLAGRIEGVKSVAGSGSGLVDDPIRVGRKIDVCGFTPVTAYAHWSDVPGAPPIEWVSQSGTVELTWTIPMRLWLPKDAGEARRVGLPFYDRYLQAFIRDFRLGDLVLRSSLATFEIGGDKDWSWLNVGLVAVERVSY